MRHLKLPNFCLSCTTGNDITPPASPQQEQVSGDEQRAHVLRGRGGSVPSAMTCHAPRGALAETLGSQQQRNSGSPPRTSSERGRTGGRPASEPPDTGSTQPKLVEIATGLPLKEAKLPPQARRAPRKQSEVSDEEMRSLNRAYLGLRQPLGDLSQSSKATHEEAVTLRQGAGKLLHGSTSLLQGVERLGRSVDELSTIAQDAQGAMNAYFTGRGQLRAERRRLRETLEQVRVTLEPLARAQQQGGDAKEPKDEAAQG